MAVSLFAVGPPAFHYRNTAKPPELSQHLEMSRECTSAQPSASFRPSTLSTVIMLIDFLMNGDTADESTAHIPRLAPFENVHQNHCRLLGWGLTVPWCWLMWGNETSIHFETVIQIVSTRVSIGVLTEFAFQTVTWLQHFGVWKLDDRPLYNSYNCQSSSNCCCRCREYLTGCAARSDAGLSCKKFRFFRSVHMTDYVSDVAQSLIAQPISESFTLAERRVLYKACWSISYLTRRYEHKLDDTLMAKTYQRLFMLLLSLGFDEVDMSSG
jgi:hypothetical protein